MRHLDVEQARALRAKYPDWPRWTERGELWAARTLGPGWHEANTPLDALYAALMEDE
jgi:hypothetical protein